MARVRSPNYPQIGLGAAIERARGIWKAERQNRIDRDTAVKIMGFSGYNGASAGVISALFKYGILEPMGDGESKLSDLGVRLIVPHDEQEKAAAIAEAASKPPLFVELAERWPDSPPSEHSLRTYLTRRGFADSALEGVMKSYWDTVELVRGTSPQYDTGLDDRVGASAMESQVGLTAEKPPLATVTLPAVAPSQATATSGPGLNLVRTDAGYVVYLSGAVLTKGHVDEVVTLLTALKASMPDKQPEPMQPTEH